MLKLKCASYLSTSYVMSGDQVFHMSFSCPTCYGFVLHRLVVLQFDSLVVLTDVVYISYVLYKFFSLICALCTKRNRF